MSDAADLVQVHAILHRATRAEREHIAGMAMAAALTLYPKAERAKALDDACLEFLRLLDTLD